MRRLALALLLASGFASAQLRQVGAHKVDGSDLWNLPHATTLPATCSVGDIYADSDAPSGARIYLCESANTWVAQGGSGTVTTTGTLAAGQVALGSGATSITGDAGLTYSGTGTTFKLGIGTDVFVSRASAGLLLVEDGAGNARDLQARTYKSYNLGGPGATDFELATVGWSANTLTFATTYGGTGSPRQIVFSAPGAAINFVSGSIATAGVIYPSTNNTDDIGLPGAALLYRTGYFGTSLVSPLLVSGPGKSGTNVAGTNNTIQAEPGTGSATGSSIIFQTPTAVGSGTTAQTQTTRLTVNEAVVNVSGALGVGVPAPAGGGMVIEANGGIYSYTGGVRSDVANDVAFFAANGGITVATRVITPVVQLTLATPTTSGDTCVAGTFWADASFLYVCTATNTIKRAALSAF